MRSQTTGDGRQQWPRVDQADCPEDGVDDVEDRLGVLEKAHRVTGEQRQARNLAVPLPGVLDLQVDQIDGCHLGVVTVSQMCGVLPLATAQFQDTPPA